MELKNQKRIAHSVLQEYSDVEARPTKYKTFSYTGNNLTQTNLYEDAGLSDLLFTTDLTYTGNKLTQSVVTRDRDSATATKTFTYTGNKLTQVDIT
jgi:hypothetical protein